MCVTVWEAEEIEGVPVDVRDWTPLITFSLLIEKKEMNNMKKQTHYIIPGREKQPIELMRLGLNDSEFEGYCIGNVLKYILRYKHKDGENDLYKARTYIDFLMRSHNHEPILGDDDDGDVDEVTA